MIFFFMHPSVSTKDLGALAQLFSYNEMHLFSIKQLFKLLATPITNEREHSDKRQTLWQLNGLRYTRY